MSIALPNYYGNVSVVASVTITISGTNINFTISAIINYDSKVQGIYNVEATPVN